VVIAAWRKAGVFKETLILRRKVSGTAMTVKHE
jgi:hypothetical protein